MEIDNFSEPVDTGNLLFKIRDDVNTNTETEIHKIRINSFVDTKIIGLNYFRVGYVIRNTDDIFFAVTFHKQKEVGYPIYIKTGYLKNNPFKVRIVNLQTGREENVRDIKGLFYH